MSIDYSGNIYEGYHFFDEGFGKMEYPNGDVYSGEWSVGYKDGHGTMEYSNGDKYEGNWQHDVKSGQGTMKYSNGNIYCGEWHDGKMDGRGTMRYSNGNIYCGEWYKGKMYGRGMMKFSNGDVYSGNWLEDVINGHGTMKYSNGDKYEGEWSNGMAQGRGTMRYSNGNIYCGEWYYGKIYGRGMMKFSNGSVYSGNWLENYYFGQGIMRYSNGNISEGLWINHELKEGTIKFTDGTIKKIKNGLTDSNEPKEQNFTNGLKKSGELKSPNIKSQKSGDCWAHTVSRNFVRTLQILDVIKSKYVEQFYDLFYVIITSYADCNLGGNTSSMFYLLDYLKNNYYEGIFRIKYHKSKCYKKYCEPSKLDEFILGNLTLEEKKILTNDLKYLFDNNLLFIGTYTYIVNPSGSNKPSKAIKTMLYYRLQPYVSFSVNSTIENAIKEPSNNFPSIPTLTNYDDNCQSGDVSYLHAVNLRRWKTNGIEFKNSWGTYSSNEGNFSVSDLSNLLCKKKDNTYENYIEFASLMFNYDYLVNEYKKRVNKKLCKYWKTFDDTLEIEEPTYYSGSYNKYGLFEGYGEMTFSNGDIYKGNWNNGFINGHGIKIYSNGNFYEGNWSYDKANGHGIMTYPDVGIYDGEWTDGYQEGHGKMTFSNGNVYSGEWLNNKFNGRGIMTYPDGHIYNGEWFDGIINGRGIMTYPDGRIYEGEWFDGIINGRGIMTYPDGYIYNGEWFDGIINGRGIMTYPDGRIRNGEWKNGEYVNYGQKYLKYKHKYLRLKKNIF